MFNVFQHFEVLSINYDFASNFFSFLVVLFLFQVFLKKSMITFAKLLNIAFQSILEKKMKIFHSVLSLLFFYVFFMNLFGLIPMLQSFHTQILFTLICSLLMWSSSFFSSFMFNPKSFASNLIPTGVSLGLAPLMCIIELISQLMRPLTLAIRLTANMTAGHVMLSLIMTVSFYLFMKGAALSSLMFLLWMSYLVVETLICFIQAMIFSILNAIYMAEHL